MPRSRVAGLLGVADAGWVAAATVPSAVMLGIG